MQICHVQKEGSREVTRKITFYNLSLIILVGYRVQSQVAGLNAKTLEM